MAVRDQHRNASLQPPRNLIYAAPLLSHSTLELPSPFASARPLRCDAARRATALRGWPRRPYPSGQAIRTKMRELFGATTEDEFDALPLAVQRKYFSSLERLRFAQSSCTASHNTADSVQRRRLIADRRGLRSPNLDSRPQTNSGTGGRRLQKTNRSASFDSVDPSWFMSLPEKIQKREFTREQRILLAGQMEDSVLLDAADQAVYKATRRPSQSRAPRAISPSCSSSRASMDSARSTRKTRSSSLRREMMDTFRWMDEEKDLDLRLYLDDYHANLDGFVLPSPTSGQRPSFRRNLSVSKVPFGRASLSSINLGSPFKSAGPSPASQKTRTASLTAPKHATSSSISSIDPHATHYQNPEARLKLRVYLASPQKFDEAIEFGFPSMDGVTSTADKENRSPGKNSREEGARKSNVTDSTAVTFFNDDTMSLSDDDVSITEPESPVTPHEPDGEFKPPRRALSNSSSKLTSPTADYPRWKRPTPYCPTEGYAQATPGSREMTLRMTLTRPDLRADDSTLYGWQTIKAKTPLLEEPLAREAMPTEKYHIRGPLEGPDGWGSMERDNGVVKRMWNKVKSSQRKSP